MKKDNKKRKEIKRYSIVEYAGKQYRKVSTIEEYQELLKIIRTINSKKSHENFYGNVTLKEYEGGYIATICCYRKLSIKRTLKDIDDETIKYLEKTYSELGLIWDKTSNAYLEKLQEIQQQEETNNQELIKYQGEISWDKAIEALENFDGATEDNADDIETLGNALDEVFNQRYELEMSITDDILTDVDNIVSMAENAADAVSKIGDGFKVAADDAEDEVLGVMQRNLTLGGKHKGADIQRSAGPIGRHIRGVGADGFHHSLHKFVLGKHGHPHSAAGFRHPGGVQVGAEADDMAVGRRVGLQTLKAGLGILQNTGALIHFNGGVGGQTARVPLTVFEIGHKALLGLHVAKSQIAPVDIFLFHRETTFLIIKRYSTTANVNGQ